MLPGFRDAAGRIYAVAGVPPAGTEFWRGLAVSDAGQLYIETGSDPTKVLDIDFLNAGPLDGRITFTRTTTATYMNAAGLIATAAINAPRFEYDSNGNPLGLLIEGARTNLCLWSEDFSQSFWAKQAVTIGAASTVSPSGGTAQKLVESATANSHKVSAFMTQQISSVTATVFAKAAGRDWLVVEAVGNNYAYFNVATGEIGTVVADSATITPVANGWFKCTVTSGTPTNGAFTLYLAQADGVRNYQGDGVSGVDIWGAQLELGPFASSYIPTTTAAVTREADNATMTGTNFSSWYNAAAGTFGVQSSVLKYVDGYGVELDMGGLVGVGAAAPRIRHGYGNQSGRPITSQIYDGTVNLVPTTDAFTNLVSGASNKTALRYTSSVSSASVALNGILNAAVTGAALTLSALTSMKIGNMPDVDAYLFGHIQRLVYWNRALTDQEMIDVTGGAQTRMYPADPVTGALKVAIGGLKHNSYGGLPVTDVGDIIGTLDATPLPSDPFVAGVRVSPTNGVYFTTAAPPGVFGFSTGYSSGFGA